MAAVENNEVQQVFDSSLGNKSFELSSPLRNDFTFLCNGLDSFLESLKLDAELPKGPEARLVSGACVVRPDPEDPICPGVPPLPTNRPRTSVVSKPSNSTKVLLKDYDCPKPLTFFNRTIPVSSTQKFTRSIEFAQRRPSRSIDCLSGCRFPSKLRSLYKEIKPAPESVPTPQKTRRRRQRNRLSLSDHAFDNDDAHGRRNLLPTDEDLRTTFEKIYNFRGIPYIFKCSRGKSCDCPSKCAQQVDSFTLYMEINPKPGTPLHPLVRENIDCVTGESCVVDELSASFAVTAVQCQKTPLNRLFIPVSYNLKDKIGCLEGIIPEDFPETKIEEPVRGVVEDLLDFVDRQLSFNLKVEYDPDALSSAENSFSEVASQENIDCQEFKSYVSTVEPESSEQRKKRGKCKEQNKVLRELRKLMNISVTDETEEVTDSDDVKCSEPSCSLGCVCVSVHEKYHPPPDHCGNISCMFECVCSDKSREMYLNLGDLSKDEKSWHQTVIRKRNNALEIKSGVDRSKRRKKMPSRYENTVTGHMMNRCLDFNLREDKKPVEVKECKAPVLTKTTRPTVPLEKPKTQNLSVQKSSLKSIINEDVAKLEEDIAKRNAAISEKIRRTLKKNYQVKVIANNERRLSLTCTEGAATLFDVLIWCTIHHKYDCYCMNWIILGKKNNLLCRPPCFNRFTAEKFLGTIRLEPNDADCHQVAWYDQAKHCARTVGSLIDYENRNKDTMFKKKLSYLLDNQIISFSNSFVKAKPVATSTSEIPSDNYPFVPALTRKITCGVGNVVKISSAPNELVDVGGRLVSSLPEQLYLPPDDLHWESSDEEIVDKSDFLLDDDGPEFIPKPKKQRSASKPIQRFCFSSVFKNTIRSPAKNVDEPKSSHDKPESDSDIELVEDPIETYSLTSSPEPVFLDGGILSDSSDPEDNRDLSTNSASYTLNNKKAGSNDENHELENSNLSNVTNYSAVEDDCNSFSSPSKLVIDESVDTSMSPTKSVGSDYKSTRQLEKDDLKESCDDPLKSSKKPMSLSPGPKCGNVNSPVHESETIQPTPVKADYAYPQKGLFCMSLPDLGYLKVKESQPGNFIMEDPCDPKALKTFKNCKEASDLMKKLVGLCIDPEFACSEWVMVTRGVLEKYQSKPFDSSQVMLQKKRKHENNQPKNNSEIVQSKKKKIENDKSQNARLKPKKTAHLQERGQKGYEKILKINFDLKVQQNSSTAELQSDDIFQSSHKLLAGHESPAAEKVKPMSEALKLTTPVPVSSQSMAVPMAKTLVGTFPNLSEANSFIEKNYQSRVYVRPCVAATTQTTGTILTAGTTQITGTTHKIAGKFVRLASPLLSGPRIRGGVTPNKTVRTVLVRGTIAGQPGVVRPVLHVRPAFAGLKVSGGVAQTPTVATIVSTTNAGASASRVDTTASSSNSMTVYSTPVIGEPSVTATTCSDVRESSNTSSSIGISSNKVTTPLTSLSFPIRSCPKGSILVSGTSISTTAKQVESIASVSSTRSGTLVATSVNQGITSASSSALSVAAIDPDTVNSSSSTENNSATSFEELTGSLATLIASPVKQVESIAPSLASLVTSPLKQGETTADSASAPDSLLAEQVSSDGPLLPKHSDPHKVPGTFVIESFSTSSSSVSASTPSTITVRHGRPVVPKPVIQRVPPRRADVIVPRDDDFATLISPAPSDTPPTAKVLAPSDNKVFNGVLLPKSDKKEIKAYICHKNSTTKSNYRSLLQKR